MEFKKDTLEPLYKLSIGKSGDSNALYISRKMGIDDKVIEKARKYIDSKEYNYDLVTESKVSKKKIQKNTIEYTSYSIGDKVSLLDNNREAIVYKEINELNNITVFYDDKFIEVNYKRLKLEIKAEELYPEGYDLNQIFISYKERKLERDIERGSKKALKKIRKEHFAN